MEYTDQRTGFQRAIMQYPSSSYSTVTYSLLIRERLL